MQQSSQSHLSRRKKKILRFANELNKNLPASEKWFQGFWKSNGLEDENDEYNSPLGRRIPDVINRKYRYVIEVDGYIHARGPVRQIDVRKNKYYRNLGYEVFRVIAYNQKQLFCLVECIERLRMNAAALAKELGRG